MTRLWLEVFQLSRSPLDKERFWSGVGLMAAVGAAAPVLCWPLIDTHIGGVLFILTCPPMLWFLLAPWILRLYANRLLGVGWRPLLAPLAYWLASVVLIWGFIRSVRPELIGARPLEELGAVVPLLLGWIGASLIWLVFTVFIGCLPTQGDARPRADSFR